MSELAFHPVADIFPMLSEADLADLTLDIAVNGLLQPIELYEGKILDGRNRYRACLGCNVTPRFVDYTGTDPVGHVVSLNLVRRHLSESQRAMVASKVAKLRDGVRSDRQGASIDAPSPSQTEAARLLNVSRPSVQRARVVQEKGAPELVHSVEAGNVSVSAAATVAQLPQEEQVELVARGEKEILARAKEIRAAQKAERKVERKAGLKTVDLADLERGKYRVIYADPPWSYDNCGNIGSYGHAERHYPTMDLDEICALPVADMVGENAVLFLWIPSPLLPCSFSVMRAWGFTYKASFIWDKVRHNWGHYNSVRHEILLWGTKGDCQPDEPKLHDSVVEVERSDEHSEKPEIFRAMIDELYTHGAKIELFARKPSPGWEAWGNEVRQDDAL